MLFHLFGKIQLRDIEQGKYIGQNGYIFRGCQSGNEEVKFEAST